MDRFPDITIKDPEELQEALNDDLEILKGEDLTESPFVTQPNIPQEEPEQLRAEPIKPKKQISEKQRIHLESMREKAKIKKLEKTTKKEDKIIEQAELSPEVIEEMNAKEFDKWMKNMEKPKTSSGCSMKPKKSRLKSLIRRCGRSARSWIPEQVKSWSKPALN